MFVLISVCLCYSAWLLTRCWLGFSLWTVQCVKPCPAVLTTGESSNLYLETPATQFTGIRQLGSTNPYNSPGHLNAFLECTILGSHRIVSKKSLFWWDFGVKIGFPIPYPQINIFQLVFLTVGVYFVSGRGLLWRSGADSLLTSGSKMGWTWWWIIAVPRVARCFGYPRLILNHPRHHCWLPNRVHLALSLNWFWFWTAD